MSQPSPKIRIQTITLRLIRATFKVSGNNKQSRQYSIVSYKIHQDNYHNVKQCRRDNQRPPNMIILHHYHKSVFVKEHNALGMFVKTEILNII